MPSPVTLRVDKETRRRIARIARRKQVSASEVIRQAIETWIEEQEPAGSPYEMEPEREQEHLVATFFAGFAILALALATTGLYSVISDAVSQ
jgi:Arc/MetJ-type ribon-helix-helix transcriptional regulator